MELTKEYIHSLLPKRSTDANKGTFGKVLVFAGSENFPGAAYLCCAAAYRVGAGLVSLVTQQTVKIIVSRQLPEVTFLSRDEALSKINEYSVSLIGPGLGQSSQVIEYIQIKTVIDGDGLNILSKQDKWWEKINTEVVITPHPGEMSRLTGLSIDEIQKDRVNIARDFARKWNQVIVLKGANTVIASPEEKIVTAPFVNPLLATAGTGDVLAGIIAGLIAQGLNLYDAVCVGVYIHGMAGKMLKKKIGNAGALASDLLPLLPIIIKNYH